MKTSFNPFVEVKTESPLRITFIPEGITYLTEAEFPDTAINYKKIYPIADFKNDVENPLEKIVKNVIDWRKDMTVFVSPGTSITANQVKQLCEKYSLKKVKDPLKADVIILPKKENMVAHYHYKRFDVSKRLFITSSLHGIANANIVASTPGSLRPHEGIYIKELATRYALDTTITTLRNLQVSSVMTSPLRGIPYSRSVYASHPAPFVRATSSVVMAYPLTINIFDRIFSGKSLAIHENDIHGETVMDITIDNETYLRLCDMLNSPDTGNHTLAQSIMVNCNVKKSIYYLWKIMKYHFYRFNLREKSVRSMLTAMNYDQIRIFNVISFSSYLIQRNMMTEDIFKSMEPDLMDALTKASANQVFNVTFERKVPMYQQDVDDKDIKTYNPTRVADLPTEDVLPF